MPTKRGRVSVTTKFRLLDQALSELGGVSRRTFLSGLSIAGLGALTSAFANVFDALGASTVVIRRAAHRLSQNDPEVALLRDAVTALSARGDAPDGWKRLARYHREFCGVADAREIHFSWYFLPWHRTYLAIMERHLQAVVAEPSLAIPYWDWYASRAIPSIFLGDGNPLNDPTRDQSGAEMEDDDFGDAPEEGHLTNISTFEEFAGGEPFSFGRLEAGPHGGGHIFVGGNMSDFPTAGLDPLFYAHHGNIDRLWEVWRNANLAGAIEPPAGSSWDDRKHSFMDVDGSIREWVSSATIATEHLGYQYDDTASKTPIVVAGEDLTTAGRQVPSPIMIPLIDPSGTESGYLLSSSGLVLKTEVPAIGADLFGPISDTPASNIAGTRRVYLLIQGLEIPPATTYVHVHINFSGSLVELTRALSRTTASYAASANIVPTGADRAVNLKIDLTDRIREVQVSLPDLDVTLVPFARNGERLGESIRIEKLQLSIE